MKYFLHDSNSFSDEKITELYINFGYEGLGLFYTILERLAQQEKPMKTEVLKSQLKVGKRLNKCWKFMEQIDIISSNNGETFNKQLLNFSEKYQVKKEKNRMRIANWREKQDSVTCNEHVRNTPKVKLSKVKESKVNNLQSKDCGNEINQLMDIFFKFNPSNGFGNTTQRKALEWLIGLEGFDNAKAMVEYAISIQGKQYTPTITTPIQFKNKFGDLKTYAVKQKHSNNLTIIE